ncbi:MAG: hypothetical protein DRG30_06400 [Epsilonproteobacteria bacterium]|nr:MAG: hypothetical protein DRG30_06400 [Campylobacterota bacterium]
MRKILLAGSVIAWSTLFGGIVVPDMSMMSSCQDRDVISQLEPEADIGLIKNWFEKASSADASNNKSLMSSLTKPRTSYGIKKHITYLKHSVKSEKCIQDVARLENTFDFWIAEMRGKLQKPVLAVEEKPTLVEPIEIITPKKEYIEPFDIEEIYSSHQSKPSQLYIVSAKVGVNVRSNPLLGKKSEIIDTIAYGTGLIWQEDVRIGDREKWGEFVYRKNGSKHIGWIHMSYVKQSK